MSHAPSPRGERTWFLPVRVHGAPGVRPSSHGPEPRGSPSVTREPFTEGEGPRTGSRRPRTSCRPQDPPRPLRLGTYISPRRNERRSPGANLHLPHLTCGGNTHLTRGGPGHLPFSPVPSEGCGENREDLECRGGSNGGSRDPQDDGTPVGVGLLPKQRSKERTQKSRPVVPSATGKTSYPADVGLFEGPSETHRGTEGGLNVEDTRR